MSAVARVSARSPSRRAGDRLWSGRPTAEGEESDQALSEADRAVVVPDGYRPLDTGSLAPYLAAQPALRVRLGGDPAAWKVDEVGDGNLNLVFLVRGLALIGDGLHPADESGAGDERD